MHRHGILRGHSRLAAGTVGTIELIDWSVPRGVFQREPGGSRLQSIAGRWWGGDLDRSSDGG